MARKYLRGLQYTTSISGNGRDMSIFMRLCYEFWGYCVNGTASLTTPGGMPTTPTSAPANFFEGTTVLATGSDAVTSALGTTITSLSGSFSAATHLGKHIVLWSPGSTSTDDSIYRIIAVPSATQLQVVVFSGGTPDISSLKPVFTSRSALNYRVIDVVAASQLAVASGNYFVGTLSGASLVNSGQASSQFQFLLRGVSTTFGQMGMVGSPGGTWTGSAFTGNSITERITATANSFNGGGTVNGYVTLIADTSFFMGHVRSPNSNTTTGWYFYALVPQRLYTLAQDPNPLTIMVGANALTAANTTDSHSTTFGMVDFGGTTRSYQLITRNLVSDTANLGAGAGNANAYTIGPNLSTFLGFQSRVGKILYSDALMSFSGVAGQFSFARARLKPISFTTSTLPQYHLVGDNGEFIHVGNGVLWPWDGAILPYNILQLGT